MPSPELRWVTFGDFSPGIVSRPGDSRLGDFAPHQWAPARVAEGASAASIEGTFGCVALPAGGLGPGLTTVPTFVPPLEDQGGGFEGVTNATTDWMLTFKRLPNIVSSFDFTGGQTAHVRGFDALFIGGMAGDSPSGGGDALRMRVFKYINPSASGTFTPTSTPRARNPAGYNPFFWTPVHFAFQSFKPALAFEPRPNMTWTWSPPGRAVNLASLNFADDAYPDPTVTGTPSDAPRSWGDVFGSPWTGGALTTGRVLAHQARMVFFPRRMRRFDSSHTWQRTDFAQYSKPGLPEPDSEFSGVVFSPENSSGYGVVASLSSSDLFLVSNADGAVLVQGDLNFPTVRKLPGVQSVGGAEHEGAMTPIGFVYGASDQGVHAWDGGQVSRSISPQMPGNFWQVPGGKFVGGSFAPHTWSGSFGHFGDYLLAPNGFLMQYRTGAWWRLDDPERFVPYAYDVKGGSVLALRQFLPPQTDTGEALRTYRLADAQGARWRWTSQPTMLDANRRVKIREVVLLVSIYGPTYCTIDVDVWDVAQDIEETRPDDQAIRTVRFTLEATGSRAIGSPMALRATFGVHDATTFRYRIRVNDDQPGLVGEGGEELADVVVHEIRFGFETTSHVEPIPRQLLFGEPIPQGSVTYG